MSIGHDAGTRSDVDPNAMKQQQGDDDQVSWRVVNVLLDELLEAPVTLREARLEQVAKADPACAREVAVLLEHQEAVEREHFLEHSPVAGSELGALVRQHIRERLVELSERSSRNEDARVEPH